MSVCVMPIYLATVNFIFFFIILLIVVALLPITILEKTEQENLYQLNMIWLSNEYKRKWSLPFGRDFFVLYICDGA